MSNGYYGTSQAASTAVMVLVAEAEAYAAAAKLSEDTAEVSETNAAASAVVATDASANVATGVTAAAASATAADTSATTASTSATAASTSATNAAASETAVSNNATAAATSETNAGISATTATTKASEAGTSATASSASATSASASATSATASAATATTKASEASTSATQAANSATGVAAYATAAANSATAAAGSATNSATSATSADTAKTAAELAETNAEAAEAGVAANAAIATTKASEAATSASTAVTKASEASTSAATATTKASEASTSAATATTKASEASTSATTATTKAGEASTSASNAATSETNSATSATAAAASVSSSLPLAGGALTGAVTTTSTFDGRDVATDGTKLDTVATDATATGENLFINGGFDRWERGISFTGTSSVYCADRWLKNGGSTVTRVTDVPSSEFNYAARVDSVGNKAQLRGSVELTETGSAAPFDINASYTFSAWVKAEAAGNFELRVSYVDSVASFSNSVNVLGVQVIAAVTTGWTKVVYTIPMDAISPAATNTSLCFSIRMETSDVFFKITGIKFEKGSVATPYQPRLIAEELALCQRYYQIKSIGETFRATTNVTLRWSVGFMTQMRDVPAVTLTMATDNGGATTTGNANTVNSMELGFTTGGTGTYTKRGSAALDAEL